MRLERIRKALYAGALAFAGGAWHVLSTVRLDQVDADNIGTAAGVGVAAAITAGLTVYGVRNAGTVNGSDPRPGATVPNAGHFPGR